MVFCRRPFWSQRNKRRDMERRETRMIKKRSLSFIACYTFHNLSQSVALFDIGGIAERAAAGLRGQGACSFSKQKQSPADVTICHWSNETRPLLLRFLKHFAFFVQFSNSIEFLRNSRASPLKKAALGIVDEFVVS